jgi:hypothetical protein
MYLVLKFEQKEIVIFLKNVIQIIWYPETKTLTFYYNGYGISGNILTIERENGAEKIYSKLKEIGFGYKLNNVTAGILINCSREESNCYASNQFPKEQKES